MLPEIPFYNLMSVCATLWLMSLKVEMWPERQLVTTAVGLQWVLGKHAEVLNLKGRALWVKQLFSICAGCFIVYQSVLG